jgi:hypothetical protein
MRIPRPTPLPHPVRVPAANPTTGWWGGIIPANPPHNNIPPAFLTGQSSSPARAIGVAGGGLIGGATTLARAIRE